MQEKKGKDKKSRSHFEGEWLIEPAVIRVEFGNMLESWDNQLKRFAEEKEEFDFL